MLAGLAHLIRLPRVAWDTMYAEDGFTFIAQAVDGSAWWGTPYAGYLHVLPRVVASAVTRLPVEVWAWGMAIGAAVVVSLVATTAFVVARQLGATSVVASAAAAMPIIVPVAGIEGIANVGNSHSFMAYGVFFTLVARPTRRVVGIILGLMAFLFTTTDSQCILLVPTAVILALDHFRERLPALICFAAGLLAQGAAFLSVPRETRSHLPTIGWLTRGYLFDGYMGAFVGRAGVLRHLVDVVGWGPVGASFLALVGVIIVGLQGRRQVAVGISLIGASIGSWTLATVFNNYASVDWDHGPFKLIRWGTTPALLLLAALILAAVGASQRGGLSARVSGIVVALLMLFQLASLVLPTSRSGTYWGTETAKARMECSLGGQRVVLPILPGDASVPLPCSRL